jgi:predicted aspartyl protease
MRVMLALLFLLSLCSARAPVGADTLPTAQDIRDKAAAAAGPVPENYRQTIVGTGSLGDTKIVTFHSGDDVRSTFDRGTYHSESGTYHGEHWRQDYNGLALLVIDDPGNAVKDAFTTTVTHVTQPIDAYEIADVSARAGGTRKYFDTTTYRQIREEDFGSTGTVITTYDAFGQFGERTLPARWTVSSRESNLEMHYQRTEYVAGGATGTDVQETTTRRSLIQFPAGVAAVDLPVKVVDHAIYVRVNIGSRAVDLELDTGASGIVLDPEVARSTGLVLTNATSTVAAERYTSYDATIPEMRIGPLQMHDIAVDVAPIPAQGKNGVKPVGLLGFDFLAQLGLTLDYQHEQVRVVPAATFTPPNDPSTVVFDVRLGGGVPMVTVSVGDAIAERVICDTGASAQLVFLDYFTRRYPNAFRIDEGPAEMLGVGGRFTGEVFRLHDVSLGTLHLQDFVAVRVPSTAFPYNADGFIGNELLSLFTVALDYTHGHIYLTPNDATKRAMH